MLIHFVAPVVDQSLWAAVEVLLTDQWVEQGLVLWRGAPSVQKVVLGCIQHLGEKGKITESWHAVSNNLVLCSQNSPLFLNLQPYDPQLYRLGAQCLATVAKSLPPDYMNPSSLSLTDKQTTMDTDESFDPHPVDTSKWDTDQRLLLHNLCYLCYSE